MDAKTLPVKPTLHTLKCDLTPEREEALHQQLVESTNQIERLEEILDRQRKQTKEMIEHHQVRQKEAANVLEAGFEMRPVECRREVDTVKKVVRIIRTDTGDLVSESPMLPEKERGR